LAAAARDGGNAARAWPQMRVVHLPNYDLLPPELPDTDIFVGILTTRRAIETCQKAKVDTFDCSRVAQLPTPNCANPEF